MKYLHQVLKFFTSFDQLPLFMTVFNWPEQDLSVLAASAIAASKSLSRSWILVAPFGCTEGDYLKK